MTFSWEGLRHLGWSRDVMAEAEVDTVDSVGQWWMTRLGWKEVSHPSMGLGWHAQIDTILGMKGPRGSGIVQGVPWAPMRDGSH